MLGLPVPYESGAKSENQDHITDFPSQARWLLPHWRFLIRPTLRYTW
jgi:hypothetical protein